MADSLGPRVPPVPGRLYAQEQQRTQRQIEQMQRQRVTIPPQTPAGSGGPVGIVNIGSVGGSVTLRAGGSEIAWESVTYQTPELVHGLGGWVTFDGSDIVLSEGWYIPTLLVWVRWNTADAPTGVQVYMGGGLDWAHQNPTVVEPVPNSAGTEMRVERPFDHGATYMSGTDYLRAEVQFSPATGPILAGAYHNWSITKLA